MPDYPAKADRRQINMTVSAKVHAKMIEQSAKRGMSVTAYAALLFEAAYAAQFSETGDRTLDATVTAALILQGSGMDTEAIARALKCSEATVERIAVAFQKVAA